MQTAEAARIRGFLEEQLTDFYGVHAPDQAAKARYVAAKFYKAHDRQNKALASKYGATLKSSNASRIDSPSPTRARSDNSCGGSSPTPALQSAIVAARRPLAPQRTLAKGLSSQLQSPKNQEENESGELTPTAELFMEAQRELNLERESSVAMMKELKELKQQLVAERQRTEALKIEIAEEKQKHSLLQHSRSPQEEVEILRSALADEQSKRKCTDEQAKKALHDVARLQEEIGRFSRDQASNSEMAISYKAVDAHAADGEGESRTLNIAGTATGVHSCNSDSSEGQHSAISTCKREGQPASPREATPAPFLPVESQNQSGAARPDPLSPERAHMILARETGMLSAGFAHSLHKRQQDAGETAIKGDTVCISLGTEGDRERLLERNDAASNCSEASVDNEAENILSLLDVETLSRLRSPWGHKDSGMLSSAVLQNPRVPKLNLRGVSTLEQEERERRTKKAENGSFSSLFAGGWLKGMGKSGKVRTQLEAARRQGRHQLRPDGFDSHDTTLGSTGAGAAGTIVSSPSLFEFTKANAKEYSPHMPVHVTPYSSTGPWVSAEDAYADTRRSPPIAQLHKMAEAHKEQAHVQQPEQSVATGPEPATNPGPLSIERSSENIEKGVLKKSDSGRWILNADSPYNESDLIPQASKSSKEQQAKSAHVPAREHNVEVQPSAKQATVTLVGVTMRFLFPNPFTQQTDGSKVQKIESNNNIATAHPRTAEEAWELHVASLAGLESNTNTSLDMSPSKAKDVPPTPLLSEMFRP